MILPIYLYGQPVLRKQAEEIEQTPELKQFIADMYETLTQAEGCGLAAPQVGKPWRLFVVDGSELAEDYPECKDFKRAFINPELIEESGDLRFRGRDRHGRIRIGRLDLAVHALHHGFRCAVRPAEEFDELFRPDIVGQRPEALSRSA